MALVGSPREAHGSKRARVEFTSPAGPATGMGPAPQRQRTSHTVDRMQVLQEYKIWKKNAALLYDKIISYATKWPSLTCEFIPDEGSSVGVHVGEYVQYHQVMLGTNTGGAEGNQLLLGTVYTPKRNISWEDIDEYDVDGLGNKMSDRVQIRCRVPFEGGRVNKIRCMPKSPDIIAAAGSDGTVQIFDLAACVKGLEGGDEPFISTAKAKRQCAGLSGNLFGLAWSGSSEGHVVAASSETGGVMLWDAKVSLQRSSPKTVAKWLQADAVGINDLVWNNFAAGSFVTANDDGTFGIWDQRSSSQRAASVAAHETACTAVASSTCAESKHLLVTGSSTGVVRLWDLRNTSKTLHQCDFHQDEISSLKWSPHSPMHFLTSSADRRAVVWDLSLVESDQTPQEGAEGPAELLFIHGGHTSPLYEAAWSPANDELACATVSADNVFHFWQMHKCLYEGDDVPKAEPANPESGDAGEATEIKDGEGATSAPSSSEQTDSSSNSSSSSSSSGGGESGAAESTTSSGAAKDDAGKETPPVRAEEDVVDGSASKGTDADGDATMTAASS